MCASEDGEVKIPLSYVENEGKRPASEPVVCEIAIDSSGLDFLTKEMRYFELYDRRAVASLRLTDIDTYFADQAAWLVDRRNVFHEVLQQGWHVPGDQLKPSIHELSIYLECPLMSYTRLYGIRSALDNFLPDVCVDIVGDYSGYSFADLLGKRRMV